MGWEAGSLLGRLGKQHIGTAGEQWGRVVVEGHVSQEAKCTMVGSSSMCNKPVIPHQSPAQKPKSTQHVTQAKSPILSLSCKNFKRAPAKACHKACMQWHKCQCRPLNVSHTMFPCMEAARRKVQNQKDRKMFIFLFFSDKERHASVR